MKLNLKAAIAQSGKTNKEIAEHFGVHIMTVSYWINNYRKMEVGKLNQICKYLGITINDIDLEGIAANDNE